ncbi:23358_t:CDS:1 [Cetraspora pellucida]|uniref:23358_t:CDS:1 n=1 Tax=Cetraspora pellucida TaxID=1433469 RepID=A0A9N9NQQ7_9GLOM|nr:23358_t:CDS:1 [Cetraspora pellucida]
MNIQTKSLITLIQCNINNYIYGNDIARYFTISEQDLLTETENNRVCKIIDKVTKTLTDENNNYLQSIFKNLNVFTIFTTIKTEIQKCTNKKQLIDYIDSLTKKYILQ